MIIGIRVEAKKGLNKQKIVVFETRLADEAKYGQN